ncbi:hypothetical protein TEA_021041 [Camellia sinensis var. sinensis]|uniref:Cyclic nucleotide-binding domain-containing protein n=1 Tax=Camellia sinensis var. sinensis TaxID=542762 RepID=A0A4S4E6Z1_CAMSN|nr:hypothetical protein TEA_021041 [Camellia sinensis var. sinensis]
MEDQLKQFFQMMILRYLQVFSKYMKKLSCIAYLRIFVVISNAISAWTLFDEYLSVKYFLFVELKFHVVKPLPCVCPECQTRYGHISDTLGSKIENLKLQWRRGLEKAIGCWLLFALAKVPFFSEMDNQLLDAICELLVSSLSIEGTYIVREGDPITKMLFIIRGRLESSTTNGGRAGFFNSITLRPRDFCREELLAWALLPKSTQNLPSSTRTVRTLAEVEAFAFHAEDLKFVANQFRCLHSKKL